LYLLVLLGGNLLWLVLVIIRSESIHRRTSKRPALSESRELKATMERRCPVFDPDNLKKFERKDYRDSYLQTQVRGGIAYQVRALREKSGLNQTDFANKIGKKQSVVSRLENTEYGRVSVQTLLDIACALDVALLVKFVAYPDFLGQTEDMSSRGLMVATIQETLRDLAIAQLDAAAPGVLRLQRDLEIARQDDFPKPEPVNLFGKLTERSDLEKKALMRKQQHDDYSSQLMAVAE
jgi:transcriptional regulator with XRE-family HTH domain